MPRLTTPTYLFHHRQLKALWAEDPSQFAFLSWNDQLDLHKYYLLTLDKTEFEVIATEFEVIAHRRNVRTGDPSLPQRAGRAYARLMRGEKAKVGCAVTPSGRVISVRPLMRPEPDARLPAKTFLYMARPEVEERAKNDRAA